jgi:HEAT repeat protein
MPFCPECRDEYDASIETCAECGTTLVATLDEGEPAPKEARIAVEDEQVGQHLIDLLLAEGVEVNFDSEKHEVNGREYPQIVVPGEFSGYVAVFLTRSSRFQVTETDEQGRGVIGFFNPTASGSDEALRLLRKKPKEIAAMGEAVIPQLRELLGAGDQEVRRWASRRLLDLGRPGLNALRAAVFAAALAGDRDLQFTALRVIDEAEEAGTTVEKTVPGEVVAGMKSEDPSIRALCCLAIGRFGDGAHVTSLIPLLADPEPLVVEEVVEALESITGITVDLHAGSSNEEREAAAREFRAWRE